MTIRRLGLSFLFGIALSSGATPLLAQATTDPGAATVPPPAPRPAQPPRPQDAPPVAVPVPADPDRSPDRDPDIFGDDIEESRQDIVRVGQDFTLAADDRARQVVVVMGNAQIDGRVRELVVVMGTLTLGPTAVVERSLVNIAGGVTVSDGASVGREVVVIGGTFDAPPGFRPAGEHVVINPPLMGARLASLMPFVTQGLMFGRLVVPSLPWMWAVVGTFFLLYLLVNLLTPGPVAAAATALDEKALTSFGTGLLVLLLFGPASFLLAVSVAGLLVIPVLVCALVAAALLGKVAVFRWLGGRIWRVEEGSVVGATVAFLLGFAIVTGLYMVPVLGVIAFAIFSVMGLGAATLAGIAAYRREHPPASTPPPAPTMPPPSGYPSTPPTPASTVAYSSSPPDGASAVPPLSGAVAALFAVMPRAPFRERLAAFVLDTILVALIVQVAWPFRGSRVFFLGMLAYHIGFWIWKQTTVGGLITHLRVIRVDGQPLSPADAVVRGLSGIFSVVVVGLGFLWILRDPERQAWHDKIAGTYVVKVPRQWQGQAGVAS